MPKRIDVSHDRQPPVPQTASPWTCIDPSGAHPGIKPPVTQEQVPGSGAPCELWHSVNVEPRRRGVR
jgi:hypothetical protein